MTATPAGRNAATPGTSSTNGQQPPIVFNLPDDTARPKIIRVGTIEFSGIRSKTPLVVTMQFSVIQSSISEPDKNLFEAFLEVFGGEDTKYLDPLYQTRFNFRLDMAMDRMLTINVDPRILLASALSQQSWLKQDEILCAVEESFHPLAMLYHAIGATTTVTFVNSADGVHEILIRSPFFNPISKRMNSVRHQFLLKGADIVHGENPSVIRLPENLPPYDVSVGIPAGKTVWRHELLEALAFAVQPDAEVTLYFRKGGTVDIRIDGFQSGDGEGLCIEHEFENVPIATLDDRAIIEIDPVALMDNQSETKMISLLDIRHVFMAKSITVEFSLSGCGHIMIQVTSPYFDAQEYILTENEYADHLKKPNG